MNEREQKIFDAIAKAGHGTCAMAQRAAGVKQASPYLKRLVDSGLIGRVVRNHYEIGPGTRPD